jgi:hypothetical protein
MLTRGASERVWIPGGDLRDKVRVVLGQSPDEFGSAHWIGHVLKRMQLTDSNRRKHRVGGKCYAVEHGEVVDLMLVTKFR